VVHATTPRERDIADFLASDMIGVGATRVEDRVFAALGLQNAEISFDSCESIEFGGVLLLLPFLIANGLLSYKKYYSQRLSGYYDFDSAILTVAFMYLCRIKSVEQLKHYSPGEMGKLLGLDRIPEARCLRGIIKELSVQERASEWNAYLSKEWINQEDASIYYIDGHVQVYHGHLANLGKKHVSRQKLCLPGMVEFWVNNADGLPYFYITGQVNEKLQEMITTQLAPRLLELTDGRVSHQELDADELLPRFTLVFDREAYSPTFFKHLWDCFRIAVITYRKNVKDQWDEEDFSAYDIDTEVGTTMELCEKQVELNGVELREVRRLTDTGHQTSVITTNYKMTTDLIALYMFSRWSQENFFRYMRQEYDIDRIIQYGVDELDQSIMVVNREYSNLSYKLKKLRERKARCQAKLYVLVEENVEGEMEQTEKNIEDQLDYRQKIESLEAEEQEIMDQRKQQPYRISIGEMPEHARYNKLKTESKHLQNIIKIICYRAETAIANLLAGYYRKSSNEIRALVKSIIFAKADLYPDYQTKTLTVKLNSLATPRDNMAIREICQTLNDYEAVFPGTRLKLFFKNATMTPATDQEF
jgi:Skp family chaperone for outer membrane proteins